MWLCATIAITTPAPSRFLINLLVRDNLVFWHLYGGVPSTSTKQRLDKPRLSSRKFEFMLSEGLYELDAPEYPGKYNMAAPNPQAAAQPMHHHCHPSLERVLSAKDREGKFTNLREFMIVLEPENLPQERYRPASLVDLKPGFIIHVKDNLPCDACPESRLHNRIMLITQTESPNLMCLTFCKHTTDRVNAETHRSICADRHARPHGHDDNLIPLEVVLHPYGAAADRLRPASDITVNIFEPWNVEREVKLAVLGEVEYEPFLELVNAVNAASSQSLMDAASSLKPLKVSAAPNASSKKAEGQRRDRWERRKSSCKLL